MTASVLPDPSSVQDALRRQDTEIASRLCKVGGQLAGIAAMYEENRSCVEILDQVAAARAAIDAVGLLLLEDHIRACAGHGLDSENDDEQVCDLVAAVRRFVRSR